MPLNKMGEFTFKHSSQQDDLYRSMTAAEIKQAFDSRGEELKTTVNSLVDSLKSQIVGDSGAQHIGIEPISGVQATNVQEALEDLRLDINAAVAGTIPDGSITKEKLAFEIATDAQSVSITDANNHFTATNVEGALEELFTSANSLKTNVSGAIGSPATASDTGATLAGYINTEKGRIASNVGDGAGTDSLKYLVDRLDSRLDELATNVNAKGVTATSADTLAQLVTKVGQIATGKKFASGTVSSGGTQRTEKQGSTTSNTASGYIVNVTGLTFTPTRIVITGASGQVQAGNNSGVVCVYDSNSPLVNGAYGISNVIFSNGSTVDSMYVTSSTSFFKVTTTSFSLPVFLSSSSVNWIAFE